MKPFYWLFPVIAIALVSPVAAQWQMHEVRRLGGGGDPVRVPARMQIVTQRWNRAVAVPYVVYMPERNRLVMLIGRDYPHRAMTLTSDDHGATWTDPVYLHVDAAGHPDAGMATGLAYLGEGKLIATEGANHWLSDDYANTWTAVTNPPAANGRTWFEWDPPLIDRDALTGRVRRLMSFCSDNLQPDGRFQGYLRFSTDEGRTWDGEIEVPQMNRVNEAAFLRARTGDIVAACRTDSPPRFADGIDHYNGLAVSISTDNGATWSALNRLYEWGRHHPSMVLLNDGTIVMTYVVRKGYTDTPEGYPRFGIEAVISRDDGRTWDLDHRYLLHTWTGKRQGPTSWWPSSQATSSLLLPGGAILTAFGTGYRIDAATENPPRPRDVGLIEWRPCDAPVSSDTTIRDAGADSELRNLFDPSE